jgi:N-acetylated-alpha-linked acidic dipeptidase
VFTERLYSAADPTSGTVSVREIARGYGHLLRSGWKPLRTILFASWDAEEYGLIGSTEFGEDFPEWIQKHVVTYLNVDVSAAGSTWWAGASPSLAPLVRASAMKIPHPTDENRTLWDARNDAGPFTNGEPDADFAAFLDKKQHDKRKASTTGIEPLGSGSDFTVFLQHLGVAAMDSGFSFTSKSDAV